MNAHYSPWHVQRLFSAARHFLRNDRHGLRHPKWAFMGAVRNITPGKMLTALLRRSTIEIQYDRGVIRVAVALIFLLETGFERGAVSESSPILQRKGTAFYRTFVALNTMQSEGVDMNITKLLSSLLVPSVTQQIDVKTLPRLWQQVWCFVDTYLQHNSWRMRGTASGICWHAASWPKSRWIRLHQRLASLPGHVARRVASLDCLYPLAEEQCKNLAEFLSGGVAILKGQVDVTAVAWCCTALRYKADAFQYVESNINLFLTNLYSKQTNYVVPSDVVYGLYEQSSIFCKDALTNAIAHLVDRESGLLPLKGCTRAIALEVIRQHLVELTVTCSLSWPHRPNVANALMHGVLNAAVFNRWTFGDDAAAFWTDVCFKVCHAPSLTQSSISADIAETSVNWMLSPWFGYIAARSAVLLTQKLPGHYSGLLCLAAYPSKKDIPNNARRNGPCRVCLSKNAHHVHPGARVLNQTETAVLEAYTGLNIMLVNDKSFNVNAVRQSRIGWRWKDCWRWLPHVLEHSGNSPTQDQAYSSLLAFCYVTLYNNAYHLPIELVQTIFIFLLCNAMYCPLPEKVHLWWEDSSDDVSTHIVLRSCF